MLEKFEELSGLKVFSKKLNGNLSVAVCDGAISLNPGKQQPFAFAWQDNGWSNTSDNWIDNGWANSGGWGNGRWVDNGWSNSSNGGSWTDSGWSNSSNGGSWTDNGWNNSGSGCYVTTACVEYMGLADDCDEMETLRHYRDVLVEQDEAFREQVLDYYRKAPVIVQKMMQSENKDEQLKSLYKNLVQKCVSLLKAGRFEEAKQHYINVYHNLLTQYAC